MTEFVTSLKKARGLGSAKSGVHHWMMQKFTAVLNIGLSLWLMYFLAHVTEMDFNAAHHFMAQPVNAILGILFTANVLYHAQLGLRVVIEDYIHCKIAKLASLIIMTAICYGGIAAGIFWILRIAL